MSEGLRAEDVEEALARASKGTVWYTDEEPWPTIVAAARAWLAIVDSALGGDPLAFAVAALIAEGGETIWWCEKHRLPKADGIEEVCAIGYMPLFDPDEDLPCRMTERLVFPIPVESAEAKETP